MILDTLSNGLKDLFSALGAKTSDSNYAVPLLNKTNGTPQGMMDMASLASVLGVIWNNQANNYSVDDLPPGKVKYATNEIPNHWYVFVYCLMNGADGGQIGLDVGGNKLLYRIKNNGTWNDWIQV